MKLDRSRQGGSVQALSSALLFGVFALSALLVMVLGARSYRLIAARMDENYASRTPLSYIANKVRQHDEKDAIALERIQDTDVLVLNETIGEREYRTLLYYKNGYIREIFTRKGIDIDLTSGMEVIEAEGLSYRAEEDGILAEVTYASGKTASLFLSIRSEKTAGFSQKG